MDQKILGMIFLYINPSTSTYMDQDHFIISLFKESQAFSYHKRSLNNIFSLAFDDFW
jgi:hypothetical protein